jgi:glycosyltransferase involved in cell wall biosynthesis
MRRTAPDMLDQITPLILTRNEAPNIRATLSRLSWAREVVVVDSLSSDATCALAAEFPNARVVERAFDSHASQWNFGLHETGIATPWVLALDADYRVPDELVEEMRRLQPRGDIGGYRARFRYCIDGVPLRGAVYPPVVVLFRREGARYLQDGHTQRVAIRGEALDLLTPILHDDRKPLREWIASQERYMRLEADKLARTDFASLSWPDKVRCLRVVAPFAMLFYCLFVRGAIFNGRAGLFYAFQRTFAELMLALYLLQADLGRAR